MTVLRVSSSISIPPVSVWRNPSGRTCCRLMRFRASRSERKGRNSSMRSSASPGRPGRARVENPAWGVEPRRFARGPRVMPEHGIEEREQGVYGIERRPAIPIGEFERIALHRYQVTENAEIEIGALPFDAPDEVEIPRLLYLTNGMRKAPGGRLDLGAARAIGIVARTPLQHRPGIRDLAGDNVARNGGASEKIVGPSVLLTTQQNIARRVSQDPGQEHPLLAQERDGNPLLGALVHEPRAHVDPPETHDPPQRVQRQLQAGLLFDLDLKRLAVLGEVCPLSGHEQRVEMALHSSPSRSMEVIVSASARAR